MFGGGGAGELNQEKEIGLESHLKKAILHFGFMSEQAGAVGGLVGKRKKSRILLEDHPCARDKTLGEWKRERRRTPDCSSGSLKTVSGFYVEESSTFKESPALSKFITRKAGNLRKSQHVEYGEGAQG